MKLNKIFNRQVALISIAVFSLGMAGCAANPNLVSTSHPVGRAHHFNQQTVCQRYYTKADPNNIVGTIVGGALGGLVGNQFGEGLGRSMATSAGAVGGALAGRSIQNSANRGHYTTKCHAVGSSYQGSGYRGSNRHHSRRYNSRNYRSRNQNYRNRYNNRNQ